MQKDHTPRTIRKLLRSLDDASLARFHYCYQIGSTFVRLGLMERTIIHAMSMCDRISVQNVLGDDAKRWEKFIQKQTRLEASTLGSLISILAKHSISDADLKYLRWLKEKRDLFIHRWFRGEIWPGDMSDEECRIFVRHLLYLEVIFSRAEQRIRSILDRANLIKLHDMGANGAIMLNPNALSGVFGDDWLDVAESVTHAHIENLKTQD